MKGKILLQFHDKDDYRKVYKVDDIVEFSADRFRELKALGLVAEVRQKEQKEPKEPKTKVNSDVNS